MRRTLTALWSSDAPLTFTGLVMVTACLLSLPAIWLDPRIITGMPAWVKPTKFAASIAIYCFSLAWVFSYLRDWTRTRRIVGVLSSVVFFTELAIIDLQAWRGTTSHFNTSTPFDGALFSIMGTGIMLQTLAAVAAAVALWRQPFADRALGWALRLGFTISILGAASGGFMVPPRAEQLARAEVTHRMDVAGSHTIGGPDGGPGVPGLGWSLEHGDVRPAHFVGLHGLQAMALVFFAFRRRIPLPQRSPFVVTMGISYVVLFAILLWQALRGVSVFVPDRATFAALAIWALVTAVASVWFATRPTSSLPTQLGATA